MMLFYYNLWWRSHDIDDDPRPDDIRCFAGDDYDDASDDDGDGDPR